MPVHTTSEGVRIAYQLHGDGAALLLLHGLGSRADDWADHFDVLTPRRRCIVPDLRGHGASDSPPGPHTPTRHAADVTSLLDELGIEEADVIGYSMGGAAAFALAVASPSRVRSLCIVNSAPSFELKTVKMKMELVVRRILITTVGVEKLAGVIAKRLFPKPDQQALRDRAIDSIKRNSKEAYLDSLMGLAGWTVQDRIGELTMPTLVVAADQDYTPVAVKEAYVAAMPNARLIVVEDARHGLPLEKVDEFNAILASWLDEVAAG
jgi:pimeloyl-ACP methyl ester carboxylesterase